MDLTKIISDNKTNKENKILFFSILALALAISIPHYIIAFRMDGIWLYIHIIIRKLYFLPIILAAISGGLKWTILLSAFVTIIFLPHALIHWPNSFLASFENIFEIALFWLIGIISGILIDRLKYSHAKIIRVVTLERVSNLLDVISSEITVDYNACVGLAKALTNSNGNSVGDEVSAKILLQRLEHLGTHINNIQELSPPKPTMRIKYSIFQLVKIAVEETKQTDANFEITLGGTKKLTGIYMDKERLQFAFSSLLLSLISAAKLSKTFSIIISKKRGFIYVCFFIKKVHDLEFITNWNPFYLPENGYSSSLASSIIRSHGGKFEFENKQKKIFVIRLSFPTNFF